MTGYAHPDYAASLAEFGTPIALPRCGGWVLGRPIPRTAYRDAMGCYPLFACQDWSQLHSDLDDLHRDLVSIVIVADPFGDHNPQYLQKCFSDLVVPFKEHLVIDLAHAANSLSFVGEHHRRNAQRAFKRVKVERCPSPTQFLDEWNSLYAGLVKRHNIRGLTAFSRTSFRRQLAVPGIVMFRASLGAEAIGMTLWYTHRNVAYYHLGAYNEAGYQLGASFAMFWRVIEYFSGEGLHWISLGAGAGTSATDQEDGLTRFKRGWATGTRTAYLCGRILDHKAYAASIAAAGATASDYFPAYRKGEFD